MAYKLLTKDYKLQLLGYKLVIYDTGNCDCCECACSNLTAGTWKAERSDRSTITSLPTGLSHPPSVGNWYLWEWSGIETGTVNTPAYDLDFPSYASNVFICSTDTWPEVGSLEGAYFVQHVATIWGGYALLVYEDTLNDRYTDHSSLDNTTYCDVATNWYWETASWDIDFDGVEVEAIMWEVETSPERITFKGKFDIKDSGSTGTFTVANGHAPTANAPPTTIGALTNATTNGTGTTLEVTIVITPTTRTVACEFSIGYTSGSAYRNWGASLSASSFTGTSFSKSLDINLSEYSGSGPPPAIQSQSVTLSGSVKTA